MAWVHDFYENNDNIYGHIIFIKSMIKYIKIRLQKTWISLIYAIKENNREIYHC